MNKGEEQRRMEEKNREDMEESHYMQQVQNKNADLNALYVWSLNHSVNCLIDRQLFCSYSI